MLVGARAAGFEVAGQLEWRKYYHATDEHGRNTFRENFPGALLHFRYEDLSHDEIQRLMGADIALGHPECGNFSQLNANREAVNDPGDIPLFCDLVSRFRPRFFVMDDLPKSFIAFPMAAYHAALPDYDLFPEWISNWGYGNVQRARNRFFMLGALRQEQWAFVPGEQRHGKTVADIIGDLDGREGNYPNHDRHVLGENCAKGLHLRHHGHRATWREMRDYILADVREGGPIHYHGPDGREMIRVGSYKGHWDGPAHVLTGGISGFHPLKGVPYSIRERARLQGFPDDFVFYGTVLTDEDGRRVWNHDRNMHMVRQTGKAMPIQFCEYVSAQIASHIEEGPGRWYGDTRCTNERVIQPNEHVSAAKKWYCQNVGYSAQERACMSCWLLKDCEIRTERYGITLDRLGPTAEPPKRSSDKRRTAAHHATRKSEAQKASADLRTPDPKRNHSKNNNLTATGSPQLALEVTPSPKKSKKEGRHKRHPLYKPVAMTMLDVGRKE